MQPFLFKDTRNKIVEALLQEPSSIVTKSSGVRILVELQMNNDISIYKHLQKCLDKGPMIFLVTIPIHEGCSDSSETKSESSGTSLSSSEESIETVGFGSEKSTGSSEKTSNSSENILELIKQDPKISAAGIDMEIGISSRGVEKQIKNFVRLVSSNAMAQTRWLLGNRKFGQRLK